MIVSKCPLCGGKIEEKEVDKIIRNGTDMIILNVNAGVCNQCGEKIFSKETHEKINKAREEVKIGIAELKPVRRTYIYGV